MSKAKKSKSEEVAPNYDLHEMNLKTPVTVNGITYEGKVKVIQDVADGIELALEKKKKAKGKGK